MTRSAMAMISGAAAAVVDRTIPPSSEMAVASTMLMIFYQFAGREPEIRDEDW